MYSTETRKENIKEIHEQVNKCRQLFTIVYFKNYKSQQVPEGPSISKRSISVWDCPNPSDKDPIHCPLNAMAATTSPVLAGPVGDCCFTASLKHEGDPTGRIETIGEFQTYIADPPASETSTGPKKVILYFADVYGPFFHTTKLLQDWFASNGFYVLGIDYFYGESIDQFENIEGFDRLKWVRNKLDVALKTTQKWIDAVIELHGQDAKYCAVGYCFGGPFTIDLAATNKIVAAAFAHPAFLNEDQFKKINKPLLMSCAEIDHTFPTPSRHRAELILAEIKATYHVQVFSGVEHGFTRGDKEVENIRWAREQSAQSIITWFKRFSEA